MPGEHVLPSTLKGAVNRQWRLAARPVGPVQDSDFSFVTEPVRSPGEGEILIRTLYLSLAPVMRLYMLDGGGVEPPLPLGAVMRGRGVGQVVASRHPDYAVGDIVHGKLGWQDYALSDAAPDTLMFKHVAEGVPPSTALGVLGITGFTAHVGLFAIGRLIAGETVLVSGAAGGVGSIVGQLAKIAGCRTIGIAGGPEKCALLTERLGYDVAIDYRNDDVEAAIAAAAPEGVTLFFDNVGGPILDAALANLARYGRVVLCGRISSLFADEQHRLANWWRIGKMRARMEAFFIYDHVDRFPAAADEMAGWVREGRLVWAEDVLDGLERMPEALMRLFEGKNSGKQLVRVADLQS